MGNYLHGDKEPPKLTTEKRAVLRAMKNKVTVQGLVEVLQDFQSEPKQKLSWDEFDLMMSPILNNSQPLFLMLKDPSMQVIFYEAYIVLVLFCKNAEYDDRLRLIFDSFDLDQGGWLDRKELTIFI